MPILSAESVTHAFGGDELFHQVTLTVEPRDRIGLVGPNGVGKTTLLLILAGLLEPTVGHVERAPNLSIGYLHQEATLTFAGRDNTLFEEFLTVFADLYRQERELQAMEHSLSESWSAETLEAYGHAQSTFEAAGGYQYQMEIKRVLGGLGFRPEQWHTPVLNLSGGEQTRVLLGRLLLERPSLLILDEPTNHLDIEAVEWLEATLRRWEGALVIVSHDRYFLERVVNRVWELAPGEGRNTPSVLNVFRGSYSNYVRQRDEMRERAERLFLEEQLRLHAEVQFIRNHIAGGQTDIAKGRLRRLSRDLALIDQMGMTAMAEMRRNNRRWIAHGSRVRSLSVAEAEEQVRSLRSPVEHSARLSIHLQFEDHSVRTVLRLKNALIGREGQALFRTSSLKLERGTRVALIGPNGSGKSTLLRTIMGELHPLDGELHIGDGVRMAYFAQAHDRLDLANRVIDEVLAQNITSEADARDYLARFSFRGDDVFKRVSDLSGGERGRLALAILALADANFLLLDEPTNHLDVPSQEMLQAALESFDGTILLVSHDRYLIDRLAQRIWLIDDARLQELETNYQGYLHWRVEGTLPPAITHQRDDAMHPAQSDTAPAIALARDGASSMRWDKDARRADARRRRSLELDLEAAEEHLVHIGEELEAAHSLGDAATIELLQQELTTAKLAVDGLLAEWELLN